MSFHHDGLLLRGALHLPADAGPHPAVVLLPGHGLRTNPLDPGASFDYLLPLIGEHLRAQGLAVLQYGRPGTDGSQGDWRQQTLYDRADEALAAVAHLAAAPELRPEQIGLLGHSNGGWVAPLAAALSEQVRFIVTVAGPGVSIGAQGLEAFGAALQRQGLAAEQQARLMGLARSILTLYRLIVQGRRTEFKRLRAGLLAELAPHGERLAEFSFAVPAWEERGDILRSMDGLLDHDAAAVLRQVRCPALAIFGDQDSAFDSRASAAIFAQAFREGGNPSATIAVLPGANHRMQVGQADGSLQIAPGFQALVSGWIARQLAA
jgi:pimeloyl-ACP methyl ester carboxylesterase